MLAVNVLWSAVTVSLFCCMYAFALQTSLKQKVLFCSVTMLRDVEFRLIRKVDITVLTSSK